MGFENSIKNNAVPEWRDFYVSYDVLRTRICRKDFQSGLENELRKINDFYFLLEKHAVEEKDNIFDDVFTEVPDENFEDLRAQTENTDDAGPEKPKLDSLRGATLSSAHSKSKNQGLDAEATEAVHGRGTSGEDEDHTSSESIQSWNRRRRSVETGLRRFMKMPRAITRRKKEKNITEFLHSLVRITSFRDMNASALLKLAKRHSDLTNNPQFYEKFSEKVKSSYFCKSKRVDSIKAAIKQLYKRLFAKNQPEKAKMVFKRIKKELKSSDWLFILSGILIGLSFALAFTYHPPQSADSGFFWGIITVYAGFLLFGFCLKIFKMMHINYKFIFNFDVCSNMNNSLYLAAVSVSMFLSITAFLTIDRITAASNWAWKEDATKIGYALVLLAQLVVFILPFDLLFYNSRIYLIGVFGHAILQPLSTVRFRHFYFADVAQSFSYSIKQVACFFGVRSAPILLLLTFVFPSIRILQCLKRYSTSKMWFPHVVNCFKYGLAMSFGISRLMEVLHKEYEPMSIFLGLCNGAAGLLWDMLMDWHILRGRYVYPKPLYVFIVVYDMAFRMIWLFRYYSIDLSVWEAIAEVVRRFLWTLLRVEVEHLNNCNELRTKSTINLTSGELFYKRDQEDVYGGKSDTEPETETETETETEIENTESNTVDTESTAEWGVSDREEAPWDNDAGRENARDSEKV